MKMPSDDDNCEIGINCENILNPISRFESFTSDED